MKENEQVSNHFFTKEKIFYNTFFKMLMMVAMQNLIAYSVNMVDNIMLGSYHQNSLSAAATVNQIFFMVQQFALSFGNALVVLTAQYWGKKNTGAIKNLTFMALKLGSVTAVIMILVCMLFPNYLLGLFTNSQAIIDEGVSYLSIIQWTFLLYILTNIMMAMLRSVGTVKISFYISLVSLVINVCINYVLIFGHFGFPELGIVGAAIGTLIARIVEFLIVLVYALKFDVKVKLFQERIKENTSRLWKDYWKVYVPIMISQVLWGVSVPMQTAILGHLSSDAIAANSVATTFYQYLKVIVIAMSSVSAVMIGNSIGEGKLERVKSDARTLSVIDIGIGIILGILLIVFRHPLLSLYNLTPETTNMALNLIVIMGFIMVGMSYQMPVSFGIIQGGGDTKFTMKMNMISTWLIVMPLSFMAAFWWKWPIELVVIVIQSDQVFKCLPTFLHFRKYTWIKKMTH